MVKHSQATADISVLHQCDIAADAKNRIALAGAKAKRFHVQALSDGSYVLQPLVLVSPENLPARSRKMLERSVAQLKRRKASMPVELARFIKA